MPQCLGHIYLDLAKKEGIVQMKNEESHSSKGTKILGLPTYRILIPVTTHCSVIQHAKYLVFVSIRSLKMRELSFAQFVYFLREVCLFFNF